MYTDGGDSRSALTFGDMMDLLKASQVTVYADRPGREHRVGARRNCR